MKNYLGLHLSRLIFAVGFCTLSLSTFAYSSDKADKSHKADNYAQLSSSQTQTSYHPKLVSMENVDELVGLQLVKHNKIIVKQSGTYFIMVSGQVGSVGLSPPGFFDLWLIHNNHSVPNARITQYMNQRLETSPVTFQTVISLKEGDTISIGHSADAPSLGLVSIPAEKSAATVPSIMFSMFLINQ
jgi:hypothetical protein